MTSEQRDELLEAATSAYRERQVDGRIAPAPEWADLLPEDREELFERQVFSRVLERAMHERAWSGTVRAVVTRLAR